MKIEGTSLLLHSRYTYTILYYYVLLYCTVGQTTNNDSHFTEFGVQTVRRRANLLYYDTQSVAYNKTMSFSEMGI